MQLSICIPTYNRIGFLKEMLASVAAQIMEYKLHNEIEVVVSNNGSSDGTQEYLAGLPTQYPGVTFRINNNEGNLGFVRNILKTVEISGAKYWWFIGDDDAVPPGVLLQVVNELKQNKGIPLFIFNQKGSNTITESKNISIQQCVGQYYYYMGNAVSICDTVLSRRAIQENYEIATSTCWPQTSLYLMSMFYSGLEQPVRVSTIEAFKFNVQNNVNSSAYYLYAHFLALFKLGYAIADKFNCPPFATWFPNGIPFINDRRKYSWAFNIIREYRFFDFDNEQREFDETYQELKVSLMPEHQHYLSPLKLNARLPGFFIKYYVIFSKAAYSFIYHLIKKKSWKNPFSLFRHELIFFNSYKEEKRRRRQQKHIRSTLKNEW